MAHERNRTALIEAGLWRDPVFWTPFDLGAVELEPPFLTYSDGLVLPLCLTVAWDRRGPRRRQVMPSVGVVGAGTMGVGMTYVFAAAGCRISVVEPDPGRAKGLHQVLLEQAAQGLSRGKLTREQADSLPGLVQVIAAAEGLAEQLDLVVESVPERLDLKREVLAAVARRRPKVLATGTSALSVDELARLLPEPESFLGMHFFNPVWSLQLVELVRGAKTSQHTMDAAQALVTLLNMQSITVRDSPGFATSRLDVSTALEAIRMLEDGVASAEDIDTAMVVAYRHPMGPLRLCDIVGLDVRLDIARNLSQVYGERYTPPRLLIDKVEAGQLGVKSGQGFFSWP